MTTEQIEQKVRDFYTGAIPRSKIIYWVIVNITETGTDEIGRGITEVAAWQDAYNRLNRGLV